MNGFLEETANSCDSSKRPLVAVEHCLLAAEPPPPEPISLSARSSLPQGSVRYCGISGTPPTMRHQRTTPALRVVRFSPMLARLWFLNR